MTTYTEIGENLAAQDFVLYDSSRLGIKNADPLLASAVNTKHYKISNHFPDSYRGNYGF